MPDFESLVLTTLINFLLKAAAKIIEKVAVIAFKKTKALIRRDDSSKSQ